MGDLPLAENLADHASYCRVGLDCYRERSLEQVIKVGGESSADQWQRALLAQGRAAEKCQGGVSSNVIQPGKQQAHQLRAPHELGDNQLLSELV
jgi:hypothetical protein